ncbi:hypothetical protein DRO69_00535 [Candidatus Bathyarchaeota archaeon]|nr:MAG: hypothetical protein DRO69_00535 [Candidatus Bathyarchaeota archaeon]
MKEKRSVDEVLSDGWVVRALMLIDRLNVFDESDHVCQELLKILDELNVDELRKLVKVLVGKYVACRRVSDPQIGTPLHFSPLFLGSPSSPFFEGAKDREPFGKLFHIAFWIWIWVCYLLVWHFTSNSSLPTMLLLATTLFLLGYFYGYLQSLSPPKNSSSAKPSSPLPRLPANELGSDAGRPAKGERLRENKCPICGSKMEEKPCFLFDAASAEIIKAKEYVCKKCGFTRVISPI